MNARFLTTATLVGVIAGLLPAKAADPQLLNLVMPDAKVLAGVADVLEQERLGRLVVTQDLSVRNLERLIQEPSLKPSAKVGATPSAHIQELEKSFSRQLGMRVQIRSAGKKGRIIIHYATLDQFDQLQEKLGVPSEST